MYLLLTTYGYKNQKSRTFIQNIRNSLINKFTIYFRKHPIRLGGVGVKVQVDETKLNFNVKSHRGAAPARPCWVVCIVDTSHSPAVGYIEIVEKRDSSTLLPIILRIVRAGSIIVCRT